MNAQEKAKNGFRLAREITKKYARTFYSASGFLAPEKRLAAYSVYALCRISDESVDSHKNSHSREMLERIKKNIESSYGSSALDNPLMLSFRETVNKYGIPKRYFDELLEGMRMDLSKASYADFRELNDYCHKVAGVVGLIMLKIFGYSEPEAELRAVELGVAMQLTNILRDINEDFQRGRIYLPLDEMTAFGVTENDIAQKRINVNFRELMKFQIKRAREYYASSEGGIKLISGKDSRFVVMLMKENYSLILNEIEKGGYDIYSKRACVSNIRKMFTALKILKRGASLI